MGIIYFLYWLRAVRWRIFLKPMCQTTTARLIAPQFIGFAGLALLGRAGEVVRPYLIAKKENLTLTSQLGVWTVERIFDMAGSRRHVRRVGFIGDPAVGDPAQHSFAGRSALVGDAVSRRNPCPNGGSRGVAPLGPGHWPERSNRN